MASPAASETSHQDRKPNRLIDSTSPYLLQHAYNPVDWHPWDEQAIELARRQDKPIFLSIGYSACHWCHVMEREVFENREIAAIMNEHFINIKVDREERPDLDELYMLATQVMSGSGGWPMSVWLTPQLEPFYAGTYFPPQDSFGRPGFPKLELAIADAWKNKRSELLEQSKKVVDAIRMHADESAGNSSAGGTGGAATIDLKGWFAGALEQYADRFDPSNGGLGSAPKFPPHQALRLWLAMLRHPNAAQLSPSSLDRLREMTTKTLDAMMKGGIYDHVGGAFARYSTDEYWLVPHFEKMLYDNAQLAPVYAEAAVQLQRPDYARVARQTLDFWLREMTAKGEAGSGMGGASSGGFYSTLDADSDGAEGKFYVWTLEDVKAALPEEEDAKLIIEHFGMTANGNWHESPVKGGNVVAISRGVADLAAKRGMAPEALQKRIDGLLVKMREWRAKRVGPGLDDKVLTSWNGLMISAMAICGRLLRDPRYLEAAHRAMGFVLTQHMEGGRRLLRVSREEATPPGSQKPGARSERRAHTDGFLEDHAFLLNGLMDLVEATLPTSLPGTMARKRALELADTLIREFADEKNGGFFFTAPRHDQLFARMKNAADNATPSPNAMAIRALLRLARSSGKEQYREAAMNAVQAFAVNIQRRPDFFPTILQSLLEDAEAQAQHATLAAEGARLEANDLAPPGRDLPIALEMTRVKPADELLQLSVTPLEPVAGGSFDVELKLSIAKGYKVQANRPAEREAFATVARLRGDVTLASQEWKYPTSTDGGYAGEVTFTARCSLPEKVAAGRYTMRATVLAQPCSEGSCLAPEKVSVDFPLTVAPA
jgi:uncharacterized protein YyaL (SSP411 family)